MSKNDSAVGRKLYPTCLTPLVTCGARILAPIVLLLGPAGSIASAGGGFSIQYGWSYEIRTAGDVAADSVLGRETAGEPVSVAQGWDQFWLGAPVWCANRKYYLHEQTAVLTNETKFWDLAEQSPDEISRLTGIPRSQLSFPWWCYVPAGWLIFPSLLLFGRFLVGPSANKRYERLRKDKRYREALAILATQAEAFDDGDDSSTDESQASGSTAAELEAEAVATWEAAIEHLTSHGIWRWSAERNLHFLVHYLK